MNPDPIPTDPSYFTVGRDGLEFNTCHLVTTVVVEDKLDFDLRIFPNIETVHIKRFKKHMIPLIPVYLKQLTIWWYEGIDDSVYTVNCRNLTISIFDKTSSFSECRYEGIAKLFVNRT